MKWELALLMSLCAFATAMIPRERRAVDSEELAKGKTGDAATSSVTTDAPYCERKTPCGWIFYKQNDRSVEKTIMNTYCRCSEALPCQAVEDDSSMFVLILKCVEPGKGLIDIES